MTFMLDRDNCDDPDIRREVRRAVKVVQQGSRHGSENADETEDMDEESSDDEEAEDESPADEVDGGTDQLMIVVPKPAESSVLAYLTYYLETYRSMM